MLNVRSAVTSYRAAQNSLRKDNFGSVLRHITLVKDPNSSIDTYFIVCGACTKSFGDNNTDTDNNLVSNVVIITLTLILTITLLVL